MAERPDIEFIAPRIGGVKASNGTWVEAQRKVDGGPSVLYDAVALLVSNEGVAELVGNPTARNFVADAAAHMKFISYVAAARPLLDKAGIVLDGEFIELRTTEDAASFIKTCRNLRFWDRELKMKPAPKTKLKR